jgi:hypothetical protein
MARKGMKIARTFGKLGQDRVVRRLEALIDSTPKQ